MEIAEGLLPVSALAVGYAAGRTRLIANTHVDGFNTLVTTIVAEGRAHPGATLFHPTMLSIATLSIEILLLPLL